MPTFSERVMIDAARTATRTLGMLAAIGFGVGACGDGPTGPGIPGPVSSVTVSPDSVTFGALGSTKTPMARATDADGNDVSDATIAWSTDAAEVVAVDSVSGELTAIGNGTTLVRARADGHEGIVAVTVDQVPVSLTMDAPTSSFSRVGANLTLNPVAADSNGNPVAAGALEYASSAPDVVHVAPDGTLTANWPGIATITASGGGLLASTSFTVTASGPITGPVLGRSAPVSCAASAYPCSGVELVSYLPLPALGAGPGVELNDMWGWADPATGGEYALIGRTDGVTFVDVTDPANPRPRGHLPAAVGPAIWRDVKVYDNHAYVVADGSPGHGVQIFDLTRLRDVDVFTTFTEDGHYAGVGSVHNIAIDTASGFAYLVGSAAGGTTCGGGLHMLDLSDPEAPTFAGCFSDPSTGRALTGYTHDVQCVVYDGPDPDYQGREICLGSNETAVSIADVTDKQNPVAVSTGRYPDARYVHQGWLSEDRRYFFQNDELDELQGVTTRTRMLVWDVTDLDDPILVDEHLGPTEAVDHNMYVRGTLLFHSNYHFGLRVIDVSDPTTAVERGYFDTHPADDARGFSGSWSNYPWFGNGLVGITSAEEGFFLVQVAP